MAYFATNMDAPIQNLDMTWKLANGFHNMYVLLVDAALIVARFVAKIKENKTMEKRHFIALADVLKDIRPRSIYLEESSDVSVGDQIETAYQNGITNGRENSWALTVQALADFCKEQNPRFDRERWLGYIAGECGSSGGAVKTK